ncbi:vacuolar protein sorting-associated protein 4A-like [Liolophura sinensis]|uniref:vacuolar protein sorting-associated protein 4A-like n=1 Tax=Liolophura sinensis TaxID=3198878 RepID=UPI003158B528
MDTPALTLQDVIGLERLKDCLKECLILPVKFPQLFQGSRRPHHRGIMLYGAPGVGKTMLSRALAGELAGVTVLRASVYDFTSKYMVDGDRRLRELFSYAKEHAPSILIFDDIEGLFQRDSETCRRLLTEWMVQFTGLTGLTFVLALTLSPWEIDAAIRKRFSKRIYVPMPDIAARAEMFRSFLSPPHLTAETCPELTTEDYDELAHKTHGFSAADISVVTRDTMMAPIRELQTAKYFRKIVSEGSAGEAAGKFIPCCHDDEGAVQKNVLDLSEKEVVIRRITKDDILQALESVKPSVSEEDLAKFSQFTEDFGSLP